ncbi:sugar phosphate permease [Actinophytocola oryzae]|uniref:Sugar phosphate permease n=1 Tax=Actinophytocola oryzae TaxID=502181 RepID=A0A4R7UP51_9PSEU|nr:sugar phosphate permease [Actinophytocola oryzae]
MRRLTIATLVVCQSTQSLIMGGVALFLPLIRAELGITYAQAGTLAAATSLTYAAMQLPSGYLADRFTPRRLFLIGLIGTNLLALSFSVLTDYRLMLVNQALSGVFRALVFAPGLLLISAEFPPTGRATAMGLFVAGGFSSNILLSAVGPLLVGTLGWRLMFALFATAGLTVCGLYWRAGTARPAPPGPRMSLRELPGLLRHPILWQTGAVQFVRLAVVTGCTFWLPTYLVADRHYSLATAGLVTALGAAVTAPANIAGGWISDRLGRPLTVIRTSLVALAVTLTLLVVLPGQLAVVVVVAVNAVFIQVYFGPLFAIPVAHLGFRTAGVASGFGNLCANVGGFTCSYAFGILRDTTGSFRPGFLTLAVLCVAATLMTLTIRARPAAQ